MPGTTSETINIGPTTYTISGGVAKTLVKVDASKAYAGEYLCVESDGKSYRLNISNTFKNSNSDLRNYINLTVTTPATETTPVITEVTSVAISGPLTSNEKLREQLMGLAGLLTSANIDKLRQGQS